MSRRYVIQCTHLKKSDGSLNKEPHWTTCAESAHTLWGARRLWWKMVNSKGRRQYLYRIYDLHEGRAVE